MTEFINVQSLLSSESGVNFLQSVNHPTESLC